MMKAFKDIIDRKLSHMIRVLVFNGIVLLLLSILIVWTDFMVELVIGLVVISIAYVFLFGAYKLHRLKKHIDKYLKF